MPPLPQELKLLLDTILSQQRDQQSRFETFQAHMQAELEKTRREGEIEALKRAQSVQEEKLRSMSEELSELKQELQKMQDAILKSQKENFLRTIAVQGSLLMLILATVVGIAVKLLFP